MIKGGLNAFGESAVKTFEGGNFIDVGAANGFEGAKLGEKVFFLLRTQASDLVETAG